MNFRIADIVLVGCATARNFGMQSDRRMSKTICMLPVIIVAAAISHARATPVSTFDYFVEADTTVSYPYPVTTTTTGDIPGPIAQSTNPETAIYYSTDTDSYNTTGGILSSTGNATSLADLTTGQLHAAAGATQLYPNGYDIGFPASANAMFGDTLRFINANASPSTSTTVGFTVHVDGTSTDEASLTVSIGPNEGGVNTPAGFSPSSVRCSAEITTNCVGNGYGNGVEFYASDPTVDENLVGSFSFVGPSADVSVAMGLFAIGQYGYTDFSNTAAFSFDVLPTGVSYTSASGDFLVGAQGIPEVNSLLLAATGLVGLTYARRRKSVCR